MSPDSDHPVTGHPRLRGTLLSSPVELSDRAQRWPVRSSVVEHRGVILSLRRDEVVAPDGTTFAREAATHPGAVGVVALDEQDRMLLVRQYRHTVGQRLVQAPAGLLDVDGEQPLDSARRELAEEGQVLATDWRVLVDYLSSPGFSTEAVRIYLARELVAVSAPEDFTADHEEADMELVWAPLEWVVTQSLAGRVQDSLLILGALACWTARQLAPPDGLRPADAPWTGHEQLPHR